MAAPAVSWSSKTPVYSNLLLFVLVRYIAAGSLWRRW